MAGAALPYSYHYPFESVVAAEAKSRSAAPALRLATYTDEELSPYFFEGRLRQSLLVARLLQGLVHLVRSRFFTPQSMLPQGVADPIITAHEDFLRFEVFSACCSVYARVDLPPSAIDGQTLGCGTTNVDFNPGMVAALGKVKATDQLSFSVGADEFFLESNSGKAIEKRVQLPIRWLKGLVAVTAYGKQLQLYHDIDAAQATRFLRGIPRAQDHKTRWWIQRAGKSLRMSHRQAPGAAPVGSLDRIRILEDLMRFGKRLRIYGHDDVEASCWELDCGEARFTVMMTHDVWRGFSGEGQGLTALAGAAEAGTAKIVRETQAALNWQPILDLAHIKNRRLSDAEFECGLATLATQGQVGFDVTAGHYYHRELPFDLELVQKLQPRLRAAHKLLQDARVATTKTAGVYEIQSTDTVHTVRITESDSKCTCPWYAKHQNRRGPCKHILAAQLLDESDLGDKER